MPVNSDRSRLGLLVLLGLLLAALGACQSLPEDFLPGNDDYKRGKVIFVPDFDAVWERGKQACAGEGYKLDDDMTNYTRREIVTRWDTQLAPQRYQGRRRRAVVRFHRVDHQKWLVEVAIQKQRNSDMNDPLNPAEANWDDLPADKPLADVLLWKIERGFETPGKLDGGL